VTASRANTVISGGTLKWKEGPKKEIIAKPSKIVKGPFNNFFLRTPMTSDLHKYEG